MILRKPFAFLIKHFKMFHFVMLIFMSYVMYGCNAILSFFSEYLNSTMVLIDHEVVLTLYPIFLYLSLIFIFVINLIILILMFVKKKPVKFYIFNLLVLISTFVVIIISKNTLSDLEISLVEVRTLKLVRDIVLISILVQVIPCVVAAIRATGFNIKKFDFAKDLEELDIETKDSEEFEVNIEVETDRYLRKARKLKRHIKYVYVENKYLFSILGAILFAVICFVIYLNQTIYNKIYEENEALKTNDFYFNVEETYITKTDYKGNVIEKDYSFLVAKVNVRTLSKLEKILSVGRIALHVNDHNIYHTIQYKTEFSDLGIYYNDEKISNSFSTYLLVYKIPDSYVDDKMLIYYYDTNHKIIRVNVSPEKLDENIVETQMHIQENKSFKDSIMKNTTMVIENSEVNNQFILSYNCCVNNNECISSIEIIKPVLNTNYDKALLKIVGSFQMDENLDIIKINKLFGFIQKYGSISYVVDEKEYIVSNLTQVIPTKVSNSSTIYIEVPNNIINASEIKLKIKLRNDTYIYKLK